MPKRHSSADIIKTLQQNHFQFSGQKGSHQKYRYGKYTVIVPTGKKTIPMGTFSSIVRQSGLSKDKFNV